jgi:hypothetical protein
VSVGRRFSLRRQMAVIELVVHEKQRGVTRLWLRNALFLIDREAYLQLGRSLTGASYRRGKRAPIVQGLTRSIRGLVAERRLEYARPVPPSKSVAQPAQPEDV